jgi:hypothetical protein
VLELYTSNYTSTAIFEIRATGSVTHPISANSTEIEPYPAGSRGAETGRDDLPLAPSLEHVILIQGQAVDSKRQKLLDSQDLVRGEDHLVQFSRWPYSFSDTK